jgi:hypothetical protein
MDDTGAEQVIEEVIYYEALKKFRGRGLHLFGIR